MELEILEVLNVIAELVDDSSETSALATLNDGVIGNNDIELILQDNLVYDVDLLDDKTSALSEISQRLEVIDTRIDKGFVAVTDGLGLVFTCLTLFVAFKFLNWLMRPFVS